MRCFSVVTLFVFCRRPSSGAPSKPRDSSRASSKWWRYYHETSQLWPGLCCYRSLKIKRKKMILHLQLQYLFLGLTWMICRLPLLFFKGKSWRYLVNQLLNTRSFVWHFELFQVENIDHNLLTCCSVWYSVIKTMSSAWTDTSQTNIILLV